MKAPSEESYGKWTQGTQCWKIHSVAYKVVAAILVYLHSFSSCRVRNLRNSLKIWTYIVQVFNFQGPRHQLTSNILLRLPTTADVFGYLHRRASHIIDIHSLCRLSLTGIIWKTIYSGCFVDGAFRERLANIQPDYLHNLISVQSTGRTRS